MRSKTKKVIVIILMLCLSMILLAGCQNAKEDVIVTEKEPNDTCSYETAEKKETDLFLREQINAPEHYKNEILYQNGALKIGTDAEVIVPEVNSVDIISVSAADFNQETIDKITDTFLGDAPVYDGNSYYTLTKPQIKKQISTMKTYVEQGNLNPYDSSYDVNERIQFYDNLLETAPEIIDKQKVKPQFGLLSDYLDKFENIQQTVMEDTFLGVVEAGNANYDYSLQRISNPVFHSMARITKTVEIDDLLMIQRWLDAGNLLGADGYITEKKDEAYYYVDRMKGYNFSMTEEEMKKLINISFEDAKAIADEKIKALSLKDMELNESGYSLFYVNTFTKDNIKDGAYNFNYTRKLNNFPISYTTNFGGASEDGSNVVPWGYEVVDIKVGDDGILDVDIQNLYDIGDVKKENVKLLNFKKIITIYEQMMEASNTAISELADQKIYHITKIKLGYCRIYDPQTDNNTGELVPVWDFYGGFDLDSKDGNNVRDNGIYSNESMLTINAVDGTIIDRSLGY